MQGQHVRRLVELLIRAPIKEYVAGRIAAGRSYDDISFELTTRLQGMCRERGLEPDVRISRESLRRWNTQD